MPAKWENWPARWLHIQKVLERPGPFAHVTFEHDSKLLPLIQENCKVLVIGAGGLGCELLKDLALMGFTNIDVIDMDIIDLSNLNRQFLFRHKDIGKPKADIAAAFINRRVPGCCVTPHFKKIQEFQQDYYKEFDIVVCGLDSIVARRWINGMLISLLQYDDEGVLDESTIVPLVDGGTEGFKGNARVCMPGKSACIECTLDLYPPQVNFPMCTIANTPRLPQHCIEWVRIIHWAKVRPFGDDIEIDGDDPIHILWIFDESLKRSNEFNIPGVTYRLTQGVVKHIIPAVASTNAVIASVCAAEVFKIATGFGCDFVVSIAIKRRRCCQTLNNYTIFNDSESVYTYSYEAEKNENCPACGDIPPNLHFSSSHKLSTVTDYLKDNPNFLFKAPALITSINGEDVTLYIESIENMEKMLHHNLNKTLSELGLVNGQEIIVADATSPKSKKFILYYTDNQMDMDE